MLVPFHRLSILKKKFIIIIVIAFIPVLQKLTWIFNTIFCPFFFMLDTYSRLEQQLIIKTENASLCLERGVENVSLSRTEGYTTFAMKVSLLFIPTETIAMTKIAATKPYFLILTQDIGNAFCQ